MLTLTVALTCLIGISSPIGGQAVMSGGGSAGSQTYSARCGIGQAVVGRASSESHGVDCGYYVKTGDGGPEYVCGDANGSGGVDIDDVVFLIAYIFTAGTAPDPIESGDANCSGAVDIDDVVYLIAYIFSGGNVPCDLDGDGLPDC